VDENSGTPTVGQWMTSCPITVEEDACLDAAGRLMGEHGVRHLPVVRDGRPVGVLSERDVAAVEALTPQSPDTVRVGEAMTPIPYAVPPDMALSRVVRMMQEHRYGCAIVTDPKDDKVLGVFTTTDALRALGSMLAPPTR